MIIIRVKMINQSCFLCVSCSTSSSPSLSSYFFFISLFLTILIHNHLPQHRNHHDCLTIAATTPADSPSSNSIQCYISSSSSTAGTGDHHYPLHQHCDPPGYSHHPHLHIRLQKQCHLHQNLHDIHQHFIMKIFIIIINVIIIIRSNSF